MGWQPIETAPYGERVLIFDPAQDPPQFVAWLTEGPDGPYWCPAEQLVLDVMDYYMAPTHWMPLPADPEATP